MLVTKRNGCLQKFLLVLCFLAAMNHGVWGNEGSGDEEKNPTTEWSGYIQAQFNHSASASDSFRIRRARLKLEGMAADLIFYKLQLSPEKSLSLLDAQIDLRFASYANLRLGQYKVPFSLENLTSSSSLDFINRSLAVNNLCPGRDVGASGRDIGAAFFGKAANIEYSLGIFNGSGKNRLDNNEHKDVSGRVVYSPFDCLSVGFSYYQGKHFRDEAKSSEQRNRKGFEFRLTKKDFSLKSEYIFARNKELKRQGLYIQGGCFLKPDKIEVLIRYDFLDNDKNQKGEFHKIINLGLNWHISAKSKFQINLEFHNQEPFPGKDVVFLALLQAGF